MRDHVVFYLNGIRIAIDDASILMSLAEWLRTVKKLVGTKIVCNEGDCGACSVLIGRPDRDGKGFDYQAIDACIAYLFQLDGTHVVTVEGLTLDDQLTEVQEAMVRCHGSQCGFCTPGFVLTMHGMIESASDFTEPELRYELSGNLCRCTGYVAILQAGRSIDSKKVERISEKYSASHMLDDIRGLVKQSVRIASADGLVLIPRTLAEAVEMRAANPSATIVNGATDYGVLRNHGKTTPGPTLCLTNVEGFTNITIDDQRLSIAGGATWRAIERTVRERIPEYHAILTRFGSPQIRHAGTLAGNLATGSPIADSIPFHLVAQTELELHSVRGARRIPLESFYVGYRKTALAADELIAAIHTPLPQRDEWVKLYKISKRRDMDISTVTMGLWIRTSGTTIAEVRIAVGGVGPMVQRMHEAEQLMSGQPISEKVFRMAGRAARQAIQPWTDVRGGAEYRRQLVENLFRKAYFDLQAPDAVAASFPG